jgi:hypothetical protein
VQVIVRPDYGLALAPRAQEGRISNAITRGSVP